MNIGIYVFCHISCFVQIGNFLKVKKKKKTSVENKNIDEIFACADSLSRQIRQF